VSPITIEIDENGQVLLEAEHCARPHIERQLISFPNNETIEQLRKIIYRMLEDIR
jgi:hypothetical protein